MCFQDMMREMDHRILFDGHVKMDRYEFGQISHVVDEVNELSESLTSDIATLQENVTEAVEAMDNVYNAIATLQRLVAANEAKMPDTFKPAFAQTFEAVTQRLAKARKAVKEIEDAAGDIALDGLTSALSE